MTDVIEWIVIVILVGGMLLGFLWANFSMFRFFKNRAALKKDSKFTRGKLIKAQLVHTHYGKSYTVKFSYDVPLENGKNKTYESKQNVDEYVGAHIESTGDFQVKYLNQNPSVAFIEGNQASSQQTFIVIALDLFVLGSLIYYLLK